MGVRLGINPITWTNDDLPELGGETPLETCLAEAKRAGYEGVELGCKFPRNSEQLRPLLDAEGLALVSGWYGSRLLERSVRQEIEAIDSHLRLLSDMGCRVTVLAEVSGAVHGRRGIRLAARPTLERARWQSFGAALTALAEHLAERGVRMAYHHHMGTVVESEAEVDRLMEVTGAAVGLLLDTGHLAFAGGDAAAVARRHGGRINHVHCKDVRRPVLARARAGDLSFLDSVLEGVFTVPADGMVDFAAVLAALKGHGYAGWLVVEAEQDPAKAHPFTYARMGHAALSRLAAAAGL